MNEQALKERIKFMAKAFGHTFNQVWRRILLERFLVRLSRSPYKISLFLKEGCGLRRYCN